MTKKTRGASIWTLVFIMYMNKAVPIRASNLGLRVGFGLGQDPCISVVWSTQT